MLNAMVIITKIYLYKSNDWEEVELHDPDREFPEGERGGETHFEYIPGAVCRKVVRVSKTGSLHPL